MAENSDFLGMKTAKRSGAGNLAGAFVGCVALATGVRAMTPAETQPQLAGWLGEQPGGVAALVLHQNGVDQRAPRVAPGIPPAGPKEIAVSAEELDAYVGKYRLGGAMFTVKREGERLLVQLTGQPFFPVFASAKDEFFYKVVNAQLSFERGADGKVRALVLHQNGQSPRAERISE